MTPEQIKNLRDLAERATPGPWRTGPGAHGYAVRGDGYLAGVMRSDDAELIAAMRNALPELLDAAERAHAE